MPTSRGNGRIPNCSDSTAPPSLWEELDRWVTLQGGRQKKTTGGLAPKWGCSHLTRSTSGRTRAVATQGQRPCGGVLEKLAGDRVPGGTTSCPDPHLAKEKMYTHVGSPAVLCGSMFPPMEMLEEEEAQDAGPPSGAARGFDPARDGMSHATSANPAGLTVEQLQHDIAKIEAESRSSGTLPQGHELSASPPHLRGGTAELYRDLPLRMAEYGTCYRYEQSANSSD